MVGTLTDSQLDAMQERHREIREIEKEFTLYYLRTAASEVAARWRRLTNNQRPLE